MARNDDETIKRHVLEELIYMEMGHTVSQASVLFQRNEKTIRIHMKM